MSSERPDEPANLRRDDSIPRDDRVKRILIYSLILLIVFLLGFGPMWMTTRSRERERNAAQASLRVSTLQNTLANAAIDARRGEYEPARQAASEFFTTLQAEIDRGGDSVFNESQKVSLRSLFDTRDDAITLLARSDPASADRLVDLYVKYRQAVLSAPPRADISETARMSPLKPGNQKRLERENRSTKLHETTRKELFVQSRFVSLAVALLVLSATFQ